MKISKLRKCLLANATGTMLAIGIIGISPHALAAPVFTFNPSGIPGTSNTAFDADFVMGTSSELLTTSGNSHTGTGYVHFTGFTLAGQPIGSAISGLDTTYDMYLTFTLADTLSSGTINAANSVNNVTQLDFQWWADPTNNTTFTPADATTSTNATVGNTGDDILLASGGIISGVSGFDFLGGAYLNSQNFISLTTPAGTNVFTAPIPFFNIAFSEFNNTTQGVSTNGNLISINQATGAVDFNKVPEPASLALIGIGLLAFAGRARRRLS